MLHKYLFAIAFMSKVSDNMSIMNYNHFCLWSSDIRVRMLVQCMYWLPLLKNNMTLQLKCMYVT